LKPLNKTNLKKSIHLKTIGAYVQSPDPSIIGLDEKEITASIDAKSLYPTSMVYQNIGYDSLYGRIYDEQIIGKLIHKLIDINKQVKLKPNIVNSSVQGFKEAMKGWINEYCKNNTVDNKSEFLEINSEYYSKLYKELINCDDFTQIFEPLTDRMYILLKSYLFPLLEAITWFSKKNGGYNITLYDYIFFNNTFDQKYKDKLFYIFSNINSSKTKFHIINLEQFKEYFSTKYSLNIYGTFFYRIPDKKSFEVDLIMKGMDDRAFVKNQMLVLGSINGSLDKFSEEVKSSFKREGSLPDNIINNMLEIIGATDEKFRQKQFHQIKSIVFDTADLESFDQIKDKLKLMQVQRKSKQNGIKVTLNSGYGIYAMSTWNYANFLVSNSITTAGKIYGIKLFQQIAVNVLDDIEKNGI